MKKNKESGWFDQEDLLAVYKKRNLDNTFPALKPFLKSGMSVLDVGCGPGTITVGVAKEIDPGSAVGVERETKSVEQATEIVFCPQFNRQP